MDNLFSIIQKILGNADSNIGQFGANDSGKIMPQIGLSTDSSFNTGMIHGMSAGNQPFDQSGRLSSNQGQASKLGMSALQQYQDMSQPNFNGMSQFMNFANSAQQQKPQITAMPPNQYVQALLSAMRGVR